MFFPEFQKDHLDIFLSQFIFIFQKTLQQQTAADMVDASWHPAAEARYFRNHFSLDSGPTVPACNAQAMKYIGRGLLWFEGFQMAGGNNPLVQLLKAGIGHTLSQFLLAHQEDL